jgi:hypothetical protein
VCGILMIGERSQEPEPAAPCSNIFRVRHKGFPYDPRLPSISPLCSQNPSLAVVEDSIDGKTTTSSGESPGYWRVTSALPDSAIFFCWASIGCSGTATRLARTPFGTSVQ